MTLTNDTVIISHEEPRLGGIDEGLFRHAINASSVMHRASTPDHVLAVLSSTVQLIAPAVSVWAARCYGEPHDVASSVSADPGRRLDDQPDAAAVLVRLAPRLGDGHPSFEIDESEVCRLQLGSGYGIVFPMSGSRGTGALALIGPFNEVSSAHRAMIGMLCTQASTAIDLACASAVNGRMNQLHNAVSQLAGMAPNLDTVLQSVARSTARLLGTDAAHVMLVEPGGTMLTVRTAFGITSRRFYEATCRTDELLPGAAIRHRRVVCVRDMSEHEQAIHYQTEGVRSAMCAPMFVEGELLGVLLAAHREVREPSGDDRTIMAALASAAAVSIKNAALAAERNESIEQLAHVNRLLSERTEALERTLRFQRHVTDLVLEGAGLQSIADLTSEAIGSRVLVVGRDLAPLHQSAFTLADIGIDGAMLGASITAWTEAGRPTPFVEVMQSPRQVRLTSVELSRDNHAYVLVAEDEHQLDEADLGIVEAAVTAIALDLMRDRASSEAEARLTGGLFQALLNASDGEDATFLRRASYLEYELSGNNVVIAVAPEIPNPSHSDRLEATVRRALRRIDPSAAVFERDGVFFALLSDQCEIPHKAIKRHCSLILEEISAFHSRDRVRIAFAGPHTGVPGVRQGVREAAYALHVQQILGRTDVAAGYDELGVWALLGRIGDRDQLFDFARTVLGALVDHDSEHGSELVHTLHELANCNYHYRSAAEAVFAHPNTLRYRMARITELTGLDLTNADDRLRVELALRIVDMLGAQSPVPLTAAS